MKQGGSYIRDTGDFLAKLKAAGEVFKGAILVTEDVVRLYLSILHSQGLDILRKQYKNSPNKNVYTENIVKMADSFLKTTCFGSFLSFINKYRNSYRSKVLPLCILVSFWTRLKRNFKDARYKTLVLEKIY